MESDIRFASEFEFELPHSKSIEMAEAHRVNYSQEAEEMVNKLYKVYQEASYSFESMVAFFSSADQGLHGFSAWCDWMSFRTWVMGRRLISYQVLRGGKMSFEDISKPKQTNWGKAPNAFGTSLDITKQLNQCAQEVAKKAIQQGDAHLCHFLDTHLLSELTVSLKFIAEGVNKIKDGDVQSISHYDQGLRRCVESLYAGQSQQLTGICRPDDQVTGSRTNTSSTFTPVPYGRSSRSGYSQLMETLLQ